MANLLEAALPPILSLLQLSPIKIISKERVLDEGFPITKIQEIDTFALVQPFTQSNTTQSNTILNTERAYKFYFTKNLVEVIHYLNNTESVLIWNNDEYQVYSKNDWSQNGWVMVIATLAKKADDV